MPSTTFVLVIDTSCQLTHHIQAYINGKWIEAKSGKKFGIFNPATMEWIADVPDMGAEETTDAIAAAKAAFPMWRKKPAKVIVVMNFFLIIFFLR